MMASLRVYLRVVPRGAVRLPALFILAGIASLLEGSALIVLIPLIDQSLSGVGQAGGLAVSLLTSGLSWLGVPFTPTALTIVFALLAMASATLTWTTATLIHWLIAATDARMRTRLFDRLMHLSWPRLSAERSGDVIKALNSDPIQAGIGLHNLLMAGTSAVAGLAYLAIALMLSWQLTLLSLAFALIVLPAYLWQVRRGKEASRIASATEAIVQGQVAEGAGNAKLVFAQGLRGFLSEAYASQVERYRGAKFRQDRLVEASRLTFELVAVAFVAGLLMLIAWHGSLPISLGLVFLATFYRLAPKIVTVQGCLFRAINHATWIQDWLKRTADYEAAAARHEGTRQPEFGQSLKVLRGSFRYDSAGGDGDASMRIRGLRDVDFELAFGSAVAISGPSGHGKSTLVDALTGLVTLDGGQVLLDGVDLSEVDLAAWQRQIGLVPQEAPLFHGSIRDNIVLGHEGAVDQPRFDRAVVAADVAEFVAGLPDGYDTMVGERGFMLSGGQRQRIALARALYRATRLLILDEATSALDEATARRVVENLRAMKGEMAMILVSHEPTLLSLADRRYEMRDGQLSAVAAAA